MRCCSLSCCSLQLWLHLLSQCHAHPPLLTGRALSLLTFPLSALLPPLYHSKQFPENWNGKCAEKEDVHKDTTTTTNGEVLSSRVFTQGIKNTSFPLRTVLLCLQFTNCSESREMHNSLSLHMGFRFLQMCNYF